jgi:alkylation response protein AidB-like acyl-CoA dehydrogenase
MLVMNALGEGLLLEPYLSAAVLTPALLSRLAAPAAAAPLFESIASGERIVIVAHQEANARGDLSLVATRASKRQNDYVLSGRKSVIAHGNAADEFLISARTAGEPNDTSGISVFRIDAKTPGLKVTPYRTIDGQQAADIEIENAVLPSACLLGAENEAFDAIEGAHHVAISALCAEAVGIMKATNAATLEYTKSRKQFGQPIGKFQALQHRMADMFLQAEQAQSMSYLAAIRCGDTDVRERRRALSAAKVVIGQAGRYVAQQAVQLHGGMGMTDELIVSHYFKRLTAIDLTLGDADYHLQKVIEAG